MCLGAKWVGSGLEDVEKYGPNRVNEEGNDPKGIGDPILLSKRVLESTRSFNVFMEKVTCYYKTYYCPNPTIS